MNCINVCLTITISPAILLLVVLAVNVMLSFAVAALIGSQRTTGFWVSFIFCLLLSALVGLIITLSCKTKKQKQAELDLDKKFSGSEQMAHHIRKLKLFRQTGILSKEEYDEEINRLLNR